MADSGNGSGGGGDVEAAKDPGALKSHSSITDAEMMGELHGQSDKVVHIYMYIVMQVTTTC